MDLHLRFRASEATTSWWVKGLGPDVEVQESYTPPQDSYLMAKRAGMNFVTLTDHETIDGALTLLHHPDFFVGEEVSAFFPEDGNQVDGLDTEVHRESQSRWRNVYDLVDYLREAGVAHVLAHPIYGMPGDLDRGQVEKRLVLFGLWEFITVPAPPDRTGWRRKSLGALAPLSCGSSPRGTGFPSHRTAK